MYVVPRYYSAYMILFCFFLFRDGKPKIRLRSTLDHRYFDKPSSPPSSSLDKPSVSPLSSLGEPSSPPSISEIDALDLQETQQPDINNHKLNTRMAVRTEELDEEIGLDADALVYELDEKSGFELDDGTRLEGQPLIDHLIQTNNILKDKVQVYCKNCTDLQERVYEEQDTCCKKIKNVRGFYRNMLFFGSSRGATMLKMSLNS